MSASRTGDSHVQQKEGEYYPLADARRTNTPSKSQFGQTQGVRSTFAGDEWLRRASSVAVLNGLRK